MTTRMRVLPPLAALVLGCLVFAGSAAAGTTSFSGTVRNGACDAARAVPVSGASRIEVTLASTAQNNTNVLAEIVAPNGQTVAGGSSAAYDTPGGGTYAVRVCSNYEAMSPPQIQYSGLIGTGPAGQRVLVEPLQPQPAMGGVLGARTTLSARVNGRIAIRTRSGLAWFTLHTASNTPTTLRLVDPVHHVTRVVRGMTATYIGKTLRVTGHGLRLVVVHRAGMRDHVSFTSSRFKASGVMVRGRFQIIA